MNRGRVPWLTLLALLAVMAALMRTPIREESATMDEPLFLGAGYSYWLGYTHWFNPEQPALSQKLFAVPLLFQDVIVGAPAQALLDRRVVMKTARMWRGRSQPTTEAFPPGRPDWYFWPYREGGLFGQILLYGGENDADRLLTSARGMQVVLTLLTGVVIFFWLRHIANVRAGLLGAVTWVFNPLALGYGHLVLCDVGAALMVPLAVWAGVEFMAQPTWRRAALGGLAGGAAVCMKFTALLLVPMLAVLVAVRWLTVRREERHLGAFLRWLPVAAVAAFMVILAVYFPAWQPAPPLSAEAAAQLGVPGWFQALRPVLIPPDFFKGIALQAAHADSGHMAFLNGEWRQHGWWYYFPVAIALKTPIPLLLLGWAGAIGLCRQPRFAVAAPWLVALTYLAVTMTGGINIGIRYLLPAVPLVTVGVCAAIRRRWIGWILAAWLAVAMWQARPHYLEYCNRFAGGTANGYRYLADSNYDWGQDLKRLQRFVRENKIEHIALAYFGQPQGIHYYELPATKVTAETAQQIHDGWLVVSATNLVKPEWAWLRNGQTPAARIGYTLFAYRLGAQSANESRHRRKTL
jgi:hypothetical protein